MAFKPKNPNMFGEGWGQCKGRIERTRWWGLFKQYREYVRDRLPQEDKMSQAWVIASAEFPLPDSTPTDKVFTELGVKKSDYFERDPGVDAAEKARQRDLDALVLPSRLLDQLEHTEAKFTDDEVSWAFTAAAKIKLHPHGMKGVDFKKAPSIKAVALMKYIYSNEADAYNRLGKQLMPKADDRTVDVRKDIDDHAAVCERLDAEFTKNEKEWRLVTPVALPE